MTRAQIRRIGHNSLELIEWLNTHATVRNPADRKRLETALDDLEKNMLRVIDAPLRMPPPMHKELKPRPKHT